MASALKTAGKILLIFFIILLSRHLIIIPNQSPYKPEKPQDAILNWLGESEQNWISHREQRDHIVLTNWSNDLTKIWDLFAPAYNCPFDLTRVGGEGDGGKWLCGLEKILKNKSSSCVIYSFGVANESTFEAEILAKTSCNVFAYDPTVIKIGWPVSQATAALTFNPRLDFKSLALAEKDDDGKGRTLKTLMKENGHEWIDVLKVDIEGDEYKSLLKAMKDFEKLPVGQLLVEFHAVKPYKPIDLVNLFDLLEINGMRVYKYEPNPLCKRCCEYSLFNMNLLVDI